MEEKLKKQESSREIGTVGKYDLQGILSNQINEPGCIWIVGGNWSTQRKSMHLDNIPILKYFPVEVGKTQKI